MTPRSIIAFVAAHYGQAPASLLGSSRTRRVSWARHVAAYVLRGRGLTLAAVGRALGGRHHTTALASSDLVRAEVERQTERGVGVLVVLGRIDGARP